MNARCKYIPLYSSKAGTRPRDKWVPEITFTFFSMPSQLIPSHFGMPADLKTIVTLFLFQSLDPSPTPCLWVVLLDL